MIRNGKISDTALAGICEAIAAMRPNRKWAGGLAFSASVVRALEDENGRLMCVFDDPVPAMGEVPENDAHALAIGAHSGLTEEDIKEIRAAFITSGTNLRCI
ncbi:hypothetical protein K3172_10645 [Qipengyuania sp. 6B39]|uniref:hypothetical protein n=1 Tax=Qipengyuania proteolytica TaxID=2867239 RepID=UPI001C890D48|nr:hypothetical protein [Qipengyuania proteolytica]MBX7496312.1 hypothetical protein [Qipengyuania proteolytica]